MKVKISLNWSKRCAGIGLEAAEKNRNTELPDLDEPGVLQIRKRNHKPDIGAPCPVLHVTE